MGSKYLLVAKTNRGPKLGNYGYYRRKFKSEIISAGLNPDHRPHDPRNTFITLGKKYEVNEYALKRMVGHSIQDITENIYTSRDIEWLRKDIEKIK